jgi:RNA polymerase sigma factor (TIGR02999 family)
MAALCVLVHCSCMQAQGSRDVTQLLVNWSQGDKEALNELMPLVYEELRRLAKSYLRRERSDHTLQGTAVVHEAFLRLIDQNRVQWQSRAHFFGVAAQMIRHILVDHARAALAGKRGGGAAKLSLDEAIAVSGPKDVDLIRLDDALKDLARLDQQQGKIVELRYFGGLTIEETAEVLGISPATVKRDWVIAKAWLHRNLTASPAGVEPRG